MPDRDNRRKIAVLKVLMCLFGAWVFAFGVTAHEPITTKVRFNNEVVRVLQRNCLGCHHTGGIAMSLETYQEARPWAKAIKEEILEKRMPPWWAVKGYGEFRNAPSLTQHEIDFVVNWVEGGAPKGDDKDLPSENLFSDDWPLGKPSVTLKPAEKVEIAPDTDEQRTFVLPTGLKRERWLAAVDLKPGKASVVHCATIFMEDAGAGASGIPASPARAKASRLTGSDQSPPSGVLTTLSSWIPGQKPVAMPEEVGQLLPATSRIVLRIHYHGASEAVKDQTAVGLYFAKKPVRKQLREVVITSPGAVIPAGASAHRVEASLSLADGAEAVAVRPHTNPLVISLQATAYRPDGTQEVLIWARGHQSDWQPAYYFKGPVSLPKGTRIDVVAYFDNSAENRNNPNDPPKQVRWSDLTPDPLCAVLIAKPRGSE